MRKIEKIMISNNTMEKKDFFAPLTLGLGATRRAAMMLLMMLLTSVTAWADVQTVTYTIGYKSGSGYYLTGDDGTQSAYFKPTTDNLSEVTLSLGSDVTIRIANPHNQRLNISTFQESAAAAYGFQRSFDTDIDVTVTSASRYVAYMKLIGSGYINNKQVQIPQEVHNDQHSCMMEWRTVYGVDIVGGVGKFVITYSTTQYAYKLHYMVDGSEVSGHGNPAFYESATGATLTNLSKTGYDFDGWYDNDGYTGSVISSIAAGTIGEKTLYARWSLITYSISYVLNEGTNPSNARTSYTIETPAFDLPTPSRNGYYFRGWFEDADFAGRAVTQIKKGSTGNRTFYAKWEEWEAQGNGTRWNPYKISSEADLRALATKVNGGDRCQGVYYQQTCDITITGGDWTPIGTSDNYFVGNYDGGNYTISGININSTSMCQGLFGKVHGTTNQQRGFIQNIILENSTIVGGSRTGGIVGAVGNAHVHNCHVRSSVTVQAGADSQGRFGGVVGSFQNGTVKGCTSMATVNIGGHSSISNLGGVIGYMQQLTYTATATNCYSYGMKPIGDQAPSPYSGTATNVERVYRMRCTDGSVSLPDEVNATDGFYYDGKGYYKKGASIPLTITIGEPPVGYDLVVTHTGNNVIMPNEDGEYVYTVGTVNKAFTATTHVSPLLGWTSSYTPDGTTNPYIISTTDGWNLLCDCLAEENNTTWNRFSGKTIRLDDDIDVIRMAGSSHHDFCGTFDGNGHTLNVNYGTADDPVAEDNAAPFRNVENGCVIKNLHVAGDIYTSGKYAAGIAGTQYGTVNMENCRVSATIHSLTAGDGTHGGFVGRNANGNGSSITIDGCVFDGKLLTCGTTATTDCSGFVGYKSNNRTVSITNSLYAPANLADGEMEIATGATFVRNGTAGTNCYYTRTLGDAQGNAASSSATLPANIGTAGTAYSVSGITPYTHGIAYDNRYYMTPEALSFVDNTANDVAAIDGYFATVTLQGRTLWKDGDWNTLCLPFNVTIANSPLAGADARALSSASLENEVLTLNFTEENGVTELVAGTPYLIKWAKANDYVDDNAHNIVNPVFSSVVINSTTHDFTSTDDKVSFKGTYSPIVWDTENKSILFVGENNTLYYPKSGAFVNACRAYFDLGSASAREFVMNFDGENEVTSLPQPLQKEGSQADAWYTLDGRKLNGKPTMKGLYIHNGKKVIIK